MDCVIIYNLKLNEIEFCKSWSCQTINFNDSFRVIFNRDLKGDYFLNRVILTKGIEESKRRENGISSIISRLKKISKQYKIEVYVHINDDLLFLKSILAKNGLKKIDKLTGLVNVVKHQKCFLPDEYEKQKLLVYGESCKVVRTVHEFDKWLDVYSTSFGIDIKKIATIRTSLQKENFKKSKFILYEQKLNDNINTNNLRPVGCCLLFPTNNILGLYCLGTVKRFRNKGIASSLIDFAITYAKMNGFDLIGVQALQSDHTTEFYQRRCFTTVYTHAIFSLPIR